MRSDRGTPRDRNEVTWKRLITVPSLSLSRLVMSLAVSTPLYYIILTILIIEVPYISLSYLSLCPYYSHYP